MLVKTEKKEGEHLSGLPKRKKTLEGDFSASTLNRLKKRVKASIKEVRELLKQGNFADRITIEVQEKGYILPTSNLAGETTARRMMEEIWTSLMDSDFTKIGVYGMGGAGKTTIMKHINNRLCEGKNEKFDSVIWVTVSKDSNLISLQQNIAQKLRVDFSGSEDSIDISSKLHAALEASENFLLILDDIWEGYPPKDVGIPETALENGSKLILTTCLMFVDT